MFVGILVGSIGNFGQKGFYNAQEIGLAKALDKYCKIRVYKLAPENQARVIEKISGCKSTELIMIPSKSIASNGVIDTSILDSNMDVLIYFSDTQVFVPRVYKWTIKNNVRLFPYIGVTESHSTSSLKRLLINILFKRNLVVYKKCHCLVKTPTVEKQLRNMSVQNITVTPVGLDLTLLHQDYMSKNTDELKIKYGFKPEDKVLLFIGRLIDEKQPIRMIDIFAELLKKDDSYKLLMVGIGSLKEAVDAQIAMYGIQEKIKQVDRIPNCDIWELYRFADCFVNLNQQEIFGMAILEAMYYGCKVVAWKAPGPSFIIENGVSGYLVESDDAVIDSICNTISVSENAHVRIINNFTWNSIARKIITTIE